jgi:hypothetical protein
VCNKDKDEKNVLITFHGLQQQIFPFSTTQQKVVPCRVSHRLSLSYRTSLAELPVKSYCCITQFYGLQTGEYFTEVVLLVLLGHNFIVLFVIPHTYIQ